MHGDSRPRICVPPPRSSRQPAADGRVRLRPAGNYRPQYNVGRVAGAFTCTWLCDTPVQLDLPAPTDPPHILVNLLVRVRYAVEIGGVGIALLRARLAAPCRTHQGCNAYSPALGEPFRFPGSINPDGVMRLVRAELRANPKFRRHLVRCAQDHGR